MMENGQQRYEMLPYRLHPKDILGSSADGRHTPPPSSRAKRRQTRERSYSHLDFRMEPKETPQHVFAEHSLCPQIPKMQNKEAMFLLSRNAESVKITDEQMSFIYYFLNF